jgi:hypothetical protein
MVYILRQEAPAASWAKDTSIASLQLTKFSNIQVESGNQAAFISVSSSFLPSPSVSNSASISAGL